MLNVALRKTLMKLNRIPVKSQMSVMILVVAVLAFLLVQFNQNKLMQSQIQTTVLILLVIQILSTHVMTLKIMNGKYLFNQMAQM